MRSRTSQWFECKVRYDKLGDDGADKTVTETYVVDALTFTEAEATITEKVSPFITGEFSIKAIAPATYKEVFFSDVEKDDKWCKVKVAFLSTDEKTQKEKRTNVYYLVQADKLNTAIKYIDEVMGKTMIDYVSCDIKETPILDVYEHQS